MDALELPIQAVGNIPIRNPGTSPIHHLPVAALALWVLSE
jgi:hypothetical protein